MRENEVHSTKTFKISNVSRDAVQGRHSSTPGPGYYDPHDEVVRTASPAPAIQQPILLTTPPRPIPVSRDHVSNS